MKSDKERLDNMLEEYVKLYLHVFGRELVGLRLESGEEKENEKENKNDRLEIAFNNLENSLVIFSMMKSRGKIEGGRVEVSAKDLREVLDFWKHERLKEVVEEKKKQDWKALGEECS